MMNSMLAMMNAKKVLNNQLQNMNLNNINNNTNLNNNNYITKEVTSSEAFKEVKKIGNKYSKVMKVNDKKRMDFLIDYLAKKI